MSRRKRRRGQQSYEVYRPRPHRKRREHRLWVRILKKTTIFLVSVSAAAGIIIFGFKLRNVTVEGNEYYSDEEILSFINYESTPKNTLVLFFKNREPITEGIPFINKIAVHIKSPGTLSVEVTKRLLSVLWRITALICFLTTRAMWWKALPRRGKIFL